MIRNINAADTVNAKNFPPYLILGLDYSIVVTVAHLLAFESVTNKFCIGCCILGEVDFWIFWIFNI
jgi:hypothetical protein